MILRPAVLALSAALFATEAHAGGATLEPMNRLHVGASLADSNTSVGVTAGLDSRLSRFIFVDAGVFLSPGELPEARAFSRTDPEPSIDLRHGVYVAPGLRVPHRYGEGINWDLTARGGFSAVWSEDRGMEVMPGGSTLVADPALLAGADGLLRYERLGLRLTQKFFFYKPYASVGLDEVVVRRPLTTIEAVVQW